VISAVFAGTILQVSFPVVTDGPPPGDLEAGLVAQAIVPPFSLCGPVLRLTSPEAPLSTVPFPIYQTNPNQDPIIADLLHG
jgi:hypothetical protein